MWKPLVYEQEHVEGTQRLPHAFTLAPLGMIMYGPSSLEYSTSW